LLACCSLLPALAGAAVSCTVSATGPVFGIYNPLSASPTYANGQVQATCTLLGGGSTTVSLVSSYSTGNSGSYALRSMVTGANKLSYNLYFDAAYTQIRGDGTGGSQTGGASLSLNPGNPTQTAMSTIYGRIPAGQDVAAGAYTDTIVVTITY
jgi:spore coat protein U-like protein